MTNSARQTVAILMPGDMGHGVGQALIASGHDAITALDGRSDHSRMLAGRAGLRDVGSLDAAVAEADLILSILPPDRALPLAQEVAGIARQHGHAPVFADCNAISPMTLGEVAACFDGTGVEVIDCGIIGLNPIKAPPTRFYVSGPDCTAFKAIASESMRVEVIGPELGQASALKMVYAALTKGTWTLQTAVLTAARQLDVLAPLLEEFAYSQKGPLADMRGRVPFLPADSERWVPEMEEIAATFAKAGVSPGFHQGAAEMFRVMARSSFASETRETLDRRRTLEAALEEYVRHLEPKG
ncbi:MAG: DUF1932 domain-containing protein [Pseudomonadota bacterium]